MKIKKFSDFTENINEALNKSIKSFGQDLDIRIKKSGIETKIVTNGDRTDEFIKVVSGKTGLALIEVDERPTIQIIYLYVNPSEFDKVKKIVDVYQLSSYNGQKIQKGWTSKQVTGALNSGDIYKTEDKPNGKFTFIRQLEVETKVKNI
jgi:hypothetical protein